MLSLFLLIFYLLLVPLRLSALLAQTMSLLAVSQTIRGLSVHGLFIFIVSWRALELVRALDWLPIVTVLVLFLLAVLIDDLSL